MILLHFTTLHANLVCFLICVCVCVWNVFAFVSVVVMCVMNEPTQRNASYTCYLGKIFLCLVVGGGELEDKGAVVTTTTKKKTVNA